MKRIILYGIDQETGVVISRILNDPSLGNDTLAWPCLDFESMTPGNGFTPTWGLDRMSWMLLAGQSVKWTRKIPIEIKNLHRKFWGMKPLKTTERPSVETH